MGLQEITGKIKELRELQALIEEAQEEAEKLKDDIKAYMGECEALRAGEYTVTWKPVKSVRIDTKALREALPDIARAFTKETTTRRFIVA